MSGFFVALPALAHPGHEATLVQGLAHPFSGADHILAMLAVGLWASLRGGKALWAWPAAFVAAMLSGFVLGQAAPGAPLIEPMILASVIVLGALTAADARAPTSLGVTLIALFGLAHGYAHGSEAPANAGLGFPLGFAASTAALHLTGLGLGRFNRPAVTRLLGAGAALGGLALVLAQ